MIRKKKPTSKGTKLKKPSQSRAKLNRKFYEDKFHVTLKKIRDHKEQNRIGGTLTELVFKSPTTYLITTHANGIKLVVNNTKIYSARLPFKAATISSFTYCDHLDCFFFYYGKELYRKGIDKKHPSTYMHFDQGDLHYSLRYSKLNSVLIALKDFKQPVMIDLDAKKVEFMGKAFEKELSGSYELFGEKENKMGNFSLEGDFLVHFFNFEMRKLISFNQFKIDLISERLESMTGLAVCDKTEVILIGIRGKFNGDFVCSRVLLMEIVENKLIQKAVIDKYADLIGYQRDVECAGCFGEHILWVALTEGLTKIAQVFHYDSETGAFKELEDQRIEHKEIWPYRIHRFGLNFYYTGDEGKVMRLRMNL